MELSITIPVGAATLTLTADNSKDMDPLLVAAADYIEAIANLAAQGAAAAAIHGAPAAPVAAVPVVHALPATPGENGPVTVTKVEPEPVIRAGGAPRPEGPAPECEHGIRKYVSGVSGQGKGYAFWACEAPEGTPACKHVYP